MLNNLGSVGKLVGALIDAKVFSDPAIGLVKWAKLKLPRPH